MDSKEIQEKMEDRYPIYYMNVRVAYWKKKEKRELDDWVVSKYNNPIDITKKDKKTIRRLQDKLYTPAIKDKKIVIVKIHNEKIVGHSNHKP